MIGSKSKRRGISVTITLGIILMLIFAGPSSAVIVQLSMAGMDNKKVGQEGFFYFNVTIGGNERIPIANFTIGGLPNIGGSLGGTLLFNLSDTGTDVGGNTTKGNYEIELVAIHGWMGGSTNVTGNASNYDTPPYMGYGYGHTFDGYYGYGYGLSSPSSSQYTKLSYKITVDTTGANASTYNVTGKVNTGNSTKSYFATATATSFTLAPPNGSISGTVTATSSTGLPICGATVYAKNASTGTTIATATTIGDGTYDVPSIDPGTYTLNVTATGYKWNNDTTAVVAPGTRNSSRNIIMTADKVTLALQSGETASKIAVRGNATVFNLTATNYGDTTTYNITNSTTTATVKFNGLSAPLPSLVLNGSEEVSFNVTVNHTTAGYYPVTITVNNSDSSKSASVTLYATMRNESGYTNISSTVDTSSGADATGGAVLNNASVLSGGLVNGSTIVNTTVETNATVEDGSTVEFSNIANYATVTGGSIVINSNVTGSSSRVSNGANINNSDVTNGAVDGSTLVNVTMIGGRVTDTTIDTGYAITLTSATVAASGGEPQITGGTSAIVVTRNVNFANVYEDVLIRNLVIGQTADTTITANTETPITGDAVGCDLTVNMNADDVINITKAGINPGGKGNSGVSRSTVLSKFIHIQCNDPSAVQTATVRIYCDAPASGYYATVKMYYFNTSTDAWEALDTTPGTSPSGRTYYEATPDHLSTFAVMGVTSDGGDGDGSGSGQSTYPPSGGGFALPTVTPTATPTATATAATTAATAVKTAAPAKTAAPGMTAAGEADELKKPEKKGLFGLPGFEGIFAIAGLLAVAYLVMRKRRT